MAERTRVKNDTDISGESSPGIGWHWHCSSEYSVSIKARESYEARRKEHQLEADRAEIKELRSLAYKISESLPGHVKYADAERAIFALNSMARTYLT